MASMANKLVAALTAPDAAEPEIPRLADDPDFAAAQQLLSTFNDRMQQIERDVQCLHYEQYFAGRQPGEDRLSDRPLRARWDALRRASQDAAPVTSAPAPKPMAPSPAIAAGLSLLAGEPVAVRPDPRARLADLDRQTAILSEAIREQTEIRDAIAATLSREFSSQLRPAWDAAQVRMFRAAQELARAAQRVRDFRWRMFNAGIQPSSDIIKMPPVRSPLVLGSEADWDSEISGWRRLLESWKLV